MHIFSLYLLYITDTPNGPTRLVTQEIFKTTCEKSPRLLACWVNKVLGAQKTATASHTAARY